MLSQNSYNNLKIFLISGISFLSGVFFKEYLTVSSKIDELENQFENIELRLKSLENSSLELKEVQETSENSKNMLVEDCKLIALGTLAIGQPYIQIILSYLTGIDIQILTLVLNSVLLSITLSRMSKLFNELFDITLNNKRDLSVVSTQLKQDKEVSDLNVQEISPTLSKDEIVNTLVEQIGETSPGLVGDFGPPNYTPAVDPRAVVVQIIKLYCQWFN